MEDKDNIVMPTPGRAPIFEEPVLDVIADEEVKKLKDKKKVDLTANDRYVLSLMDKLPLADLFQKGFLEMSQEIAMGVSATFRSMNAEQIEQIANDTSRFQQKRETVKDADSIDREVWRPSVEEVRIYQNKRTMAEVVISIAGQAIGGDIDSRLQYFQRLDHTFSNAVYRKMQQFLTALSLLFPSENQKEYVSTLKKALALQP